MNESSNAMLGRTEPLAVFARPTSRSLRRLTKLAEAAVATTGDEHALILKTIVKILDECSDAEYDAACEDGPLRQKLIAAGMEFDFED